MIERRRYTEEGLKTLPKGGTSYIDGRNREHVDFKGDPAVGSGKIRCPYCTNGIRYHSQGGETCRHCWGSGQMKPYK